MGTIASYWPPTAELVNGGSMGDDTGSKTPAPLGHTHHMKNSGMGHGTSMDETANFTKGNLIG